MCVYRAAIEPVFIKLQEKEKLAREELEKYTPLVQKFFDLCKKFGALKIREPSVHDWRPIAKDIRQIEKIITLLEENVGMKIAW